MSLLSMFALLLIPEPCPFQIVEVSPGNVSLHHVSPVSIYRVEQPRLASCGQQERCRVAHRLRWDRPGTQCQGSFLCTRDETGRGRGLFLPGEL